MKLDQYPRKAREILHRYGLGESLMHNTFEALVNTIVRTFQPAHEISSVSDYVSRFPPQTTREKAIIVIATAIEEAATNAREDTTHIDCVGRARAYLAQIEELARATKINNPPRPQRSRCREILGQHGYRRLGTRQPR